MAKIRNIEGDAFLKDSNEDFIDSDLTENNPLPPSEINRDNESMGTANQLIEELFPEVDMTQQEIKF